MPDQRTASSQPRHARVVLWLAIACGFASCVYYSYYLSDAGAPFGFGAAIFLAWIILSYFGLRGRSFARWGLVPGLAAAAFVPSFILLGLSLGLSTWAEIRSSVSNYLQLAAALLWWIVIAGLVFSEFVLMDVSVLTPNMLWELDLLRNSGDLARTVLLVRENDCELAMQNLIAHARPVAGVPLVVYGNDFIAGVLAKPVADILSRGPYSFRVFE